MASLRKCVHLAVCASERRRVQVFRHKTIVPFWCRHFSVSVGNSGLCRWQQKECVNQSLRPRTPSSCGPDAWDVSFICTRTNMNALVWRGWTKCTSLLRAESLAACWNSGFTVTVGKQVNMQGIRRVTALTNWAVLRWLFCWVLLMLGWFSIFVTAFL